MTARIRAIRSTAILAPVLSVLTFQGPAAADCLVYEYPGICELNWRAENDFWTGEYAVEVGPLHLLMDGQPHVGPEQPPPEMVSIVQSGDSLQIMIPQVGTGTLQELGPGAEPFGWDTRYAEEMGNATLADHELVAGCPQSEMPRWVAPIDNPNPGPSTQMEIIAVDSTILIAHLSIPNQPVQFQGTSITFDRRVVLTRDPQLEYFEEVATAEECEVLCPQDRFYCPDREGPEATQ